jgi:hypothetical protein
MPDILTRTTSSKPLALRAIIDDHRLQTFPVKDGLTIGSDPACDICVPDALPKQIKLTATDFGNWRIEPAAPEVQIRDSANVDCAWLPLTVSTVFAVGKTVFDCVEAFVETVEQEAQLDRRCCPRCRASLLEVDLSARFCPHCGAPLPSDCPDWPLVACQVPAEAEPLPRWMMWLPPVLRARVSKDPLFFARRTTVLAYINTFFNLGLRHEVGVDGDRNFPEAMRCYNKAAQLGSLPARARLKVKDQSTA